MKTEPTCPYCNSILEKRPERKKKCPNCQRFIFVRTLPSSRERVLVTQAEAKDIDLQWQRYLSTDKWKKSFEQYNITEQDFAIRKNLLSKKFGTDASDLDVIWSFFNELVTRIKDIHELKMHYFQMALFQNELGKDAFDLLREVRRLELLEYQRHGIVDRVQIISPDDESCKNCQRLSNKVLTLQDALSNMPLPCKECTDNKMNGDDKGLCGCRYVAKVD